MKLPELILDVVERARKEWRLIEQDTAVFPVPHQKRAEDILWGNKSMQKEPTFTEIECLDFADFTKKSRTNTSSASLAIIYSPFGSRFPRNMIQSFSCLLSLHLRLENWSVA